MKIYNKKDLDFEYYSEYNPKKKYQDFVEVRMTVGTKDNYSDLENYMVVKYPGKDWDGQFPLLAKEKVLELNPGSRVDIIETHGLDAENYPELLSLDNHSFFEKFRIH